MADSFKGTGRTDIQPGTINKPVYLRLNAASASTVNDGSMPYGSSVVSAVVTIRHGRTRTDYSTTLIAKSTEIGNTIIAYLSHPEASTSTGVPEGLYDLKATVKMTLAGASTFYSEDYLLERIYVKN
jgi:hypothetical protein